VPLLADDMGLGKTIQLLALIVSCLEEDKNIDPFLIVAPVSLLENWHEEIDKFFVKDTLPLLTLYGSTLASKREPRTNIRSELVEGGAVRLLKRDWLGNAKLVLTTYETLRDLEFSLARQKWSGMICDEAQKIKNPNAMVTRAAKKQNARFKIACTGTPVENSLTDLWCLFDFAQPGLLGALNLFGSRYRKPIEDKSEDNQKRIEELRRLIEPQIKRRLKVDVVKDLPRKIDVSGCRNLQMSNRQRALYTNAIKRFREKASNDDTAGLQSPLGLLQYLRRLCSDPKPPGQITTEQESLADIEKHSPKMSWLLNELKKIKKKQEKAIVFCEFRDLQRTLQRAIAERLDFKPCIINGTTSSTAKNSSSRQGRLKTFQQIDGFGVIILSPLAVGFGVNIQAANHVIHFTRPWNPAKEDQATDRAYRIGQEKDVYVYYPSVAADDFISFDTKLDELLEKKRALSGDMLNGACDISPADFGDLEDIDGSNAFDDELVLAEDIASMNPALFEDFCLILWQLSGYAYVYKTPRSGDGGIDVVAIQGKAGALIQCKSTSIDGRELGWDAIKDVSAGAAAYAAKHPSVTFQKIAVTNQRFNSTAIYQANVNHVKLIDRDNLKEMMEGKVIKRKDLEWMQIPE
jgi:SNF2 family DNA or RNA helicase